VKRAELVEQNHPEISVREQCKILSVSRSTLNYCPVEESEEDRKIIRIMDEIYLEDPCMGSRKIVALLKREYGIEANRKRILRLRREMGLTTIWCKPRSTSIPDNGHRKYPYLLRDRIVEWADEVWCADITYVPMPHGHAYLCAVVDWSSRVVLGWAVSNTMDASLTARALDEAVAHCEALPEIFNTDQGSQFTSPEWTAKIEGLGISVSMDGKGRWMDNVVIERLWRSVKYEDIYLREYETLGELESGLRRWIHRYNTWRPHQHLENKTPAEVYQTHRKPKTPEETQKTAA
jgi:putative transposase